ncbi:MAG: hypothetical protein R3E53_12450 [Myxococcota bacterium]
MMIKAGSDVLFQEPTCQTRRLRRSVVVGTGSDTFSIRFVADPFAFGIDQEVLMYFNGRREFMQQVGRIREIVVAEEGEADGPTYVIEPVGDPISAENRQHYRVSTISAGVQARVEGEDQVQVQDLSATGFAVVAAGDYQLGQTVDVGIVLGEERCHGLASVQSIRALGPGRVRYGLRAIETHPHTGEFLEVLQRISLAIQREQLQRSGGTRSQDD